MPGSQGARLQSLHDVELATRAAGGERRAFSELVRRHGGGVRALLRRMGASAAEADDSAQDAFLAAFEGIAEFRGEGTFAAWVKRIAARRYLRRLQKERRLASRAEDSGAGEEAAAADAGARMDLDRAMQGLAVAERLCVSLCYGAGLSHGEAAEALNLPLGTVKSHVKRGLDRLRARLAPVADASERRGHG
jgi:RNA polymerase sigma-70 factor (ECF subfamily)